MHKHIKIGKIVATFGVNGQMILQHNLGKKSTFKGIEAIFIGQVTNSLLPYFIKDVKSKTAEDNYILLEDITSKETATKLIGKAVWLLQEDFQMLSNKKSPIALLGYKVIADNKVLGTIEEVIEQPHQILLSITYKDKEAYLPMHEETLLHIDHKKNEVHLELPDGLLDIYA